MLKVHENTEKCYDFIQSKIPGKKNDHSLHINIKQQPFSRLLSTTTKNSYQPQTLVNATH